jgi:phage terminase small subunit
MAKLTPKQEMFVKEYLVDLNATQAAIRAGYSEATAMEQGYQLLQKTSVQAKLQAALNARSRRTEITADRVLKEYARLGFFDPRKLFNDDGSPKGIQELDDDTAAAIAGLEVAEIYEGQGDKRQFVGYLKKYKITDKKGALDSIAKHLGMFVERHEHTGKDGGPIETAVSISDKEREQLILNAAKRIKASRSGTEQCNPSPDPGGETGLPG